MLYSDKLAIAAHLHVQLRRKLGRVTDVEWMAKNNEYALEIVRITREAPHPELHVWADKMEAAVFGRRWVPPAPPAPPEPPSPSAAALDALDAVLLASRHGRDIFPESQFDAFPTHRLHDDNQYIGHLR